MKEIKKSICPYDCPSRCGLILEIDDGRIIKVKNDPENPVSRNGICRKTINYEKSIYSEDRILYPLKRTGKKGEGKFSRISWNEAIDEITSKWKEIIDKYGSEAIWHWEYSGVMSDIHRSCGDAFFGCMGASKLKKTLCGPAKNAGYQAVAGGTGCLDPRELNSSDFYIIWGSNIAATRLQTLADLKKPENRSKKKVLIETYRSPAAEHCDQCIYIKAGTDGALALAMMHVLDQEGLSDEDFLMNYTEGYEEFKKTLSSYSPEWAESITGVPADTIRTLAREYAEAKAPAILLGSGNSRYGNGGMTVRLIVILSLFTGAWKKQGGGLCGCTPINTSYIKLDHITRPDFEKKPVRTLNINQIAGALAMEGDEKIHSLYVYIGNPVNTASNQAGVIKGLMRDDLFTVVHERFMTDTALYADIILPAVFSVEQTDIYRSYGHCTLGTAYKAVDPPGECKSDWDTFCMLAKAMGYDDEYFSRTDDEMLKLILDDPADAVKALPDSEKKKLYEGGYISMPFSDHMDIKTKSGKFMIINNDLEETLPYYKESHGQTLDKYPLSLIAAPSVWTLNSTYLERMDLIEKRGPQSVWINAADAKARDIKNGQEVKVYNDQAEAVFLAIVSEDVAKGNAVAEGIYSMRKTGTSGRYTLNALTSERLSDMNEGTTMNDNRVEIIPLRD